MSLRHAALLPVLLAAATCAAPPPPSPQARADAATLSACREHSDAVYDRTHRDSIYAIDNRNTPYSANYTPDVSNRGLSDLFVHDRMVSDCVRNTGTGAERSQPPPPQ